MELKTGNESETRPNSNMDEYRKEVMYLIEAEIRNVIDDEMKKAAQEILDEQRKAIQQIVEEQKTVIREVVEQEKKAVWTRVEELRKSILKLGLG